MKHVVSFLVVALALLQMTMAAPVDERSEKKFAYIIAERSLVDERSEKKFAYLIAERSPVDERSEKKFAYHIAERSPDAEGVTDNAKA